MSDEGNWIRWMRIGFTGEELEELKRNPIKSSCGVCNRDLTGKGYGDVDCDNVNCPVGPNAEYF